MDFLSSFSFLLPDLLVESGWIEHAPFAFWLTQVLEPHTVVELGTHRGYSYFVFNQALRKLGLKSRCFAVDTWTGDEHAGAYGEEIYDRVRSYNEATYADFSELLRCTFAEAAKSFEDGSVDLLHVDGRHYYEDVCADFQGWQSKLSNRSIVLFHDTNVRSRDFGVYRLWNELRTRRSSFEFLHGHGLGVLAWGAAIPRPLQQFFEAAQDEKVAMEIRVVYSSLGRAITDHMQARDLAVPGAALLQVQQELKSSRETDKSIKSTQRQQGAAGWPPEMDSIAIPHSETHVRIEEIQNEEMKKRALIVEKLGVQLEEQREEIERTYRAETHRLQSELRTALASLSYYQGEYESAVSSRSWKLTRPLRESSVFTEKLRKLFGRRHL